MTTADPSDLTTHSLAANDAGDTNATQDDQSDAESEESEDTPPVLNTVELLGKGTINTTNNKKEFTILVVGETGTGKTTVLSLIANILEGNTPSTYKKYNDQKNEAGGSDKHSQTNNAKLYEFVSKNNITVRILDTPGLADTRGIAQDDQHKESIARAIKNNITSVSAVLILANGTVPRLGVATDYALSTLSSIFPKTLADNIAFLFTNVSSPLSWNFDETSLPEALRDNNPRYLLDNPVAMEDKYQKEKEKLTKSKDKLTKNDKKYLADLKKAVEAGHLKALDVLVHIFDWLDTLSPQPTSDILSLYKQSQDIESEISDVLAAMDQLAKKKKDLQKLKHDVESAKTDMNRFKDYKRTITQQVYKRIDTADHNTLCCAPQCYKNCHVPCYLDFSTDPHVLRDCSAMVSDGTCSCKHGYMQHQHYHAKWLLADDTQVTVDSEAEKKYNDAKTQKEKDEILLGELNASIATADKALEDSTKKVGELVEKYAKLSLSGSFAGQVKKSIALLKLRLETMRGNGTDADTIKAIEKALEVMEKKLKVVEDAAKKAHKDVSTPSHMAKMLFSYARGK